MTENERPRTRLVTRLVRGVVACIGGVVCLYGIALFFLLLPDSKSVRMARLARQQMLDIRGEITNMEMKGRPMPTSVLDVLQHAERSLDTTDTNWRRLSGIDPWGTPYLVEAIREPAPSTSSYRINVRSFGPNRRDDHGKKDDLQISLPNWLPVPPRMDPPRQLGEPPVAP